MHYHKTSRWATRGWSGTKLKSTRMCLALKLLLSWKPHCWGIHPSYWQVNLLPTWKPFLLAHLAFIFNSLPPRSWSACQPDSHLRSSTPPWTSFQNWLGLSHLDCQQGRPPLLQGAAFRWTNMNLAKIKYQIREALKKKNRHFLGKSPKLWVGGGQES